MTQGPANPVLPPEPPLRDREIVVAVCGGIAVYKAADVVSKLAQLGATVTVCMTAAATRFVTPLTFQALSGRPVRTDTFDLSSPPPTQHIALTENAALLLVVPATANMIAKVATGLCDDLVSLVINASACPVLFAPAMNTRMWANPITQENVAKLTRLGYLFIGPEEGWLACRSTGKGRMTEPADIVREVVRQAGLHTPSAIPPNTP
jgi:phosphopantothenoylcysteine decarboxylase/phosphopantothenate--cysteine ligase